MKRSKALHLFILLVLPALIQAQYLANPSLEGPVGIGLVPLQWQPFNPLGTPDTEPLDCDEFPASEGDSYLTLVGHGNNSSKSGINENCQTDLIQTMEEGLCYSLSVDLASRDDLGHYVRGTGFIHYQEEVRLIIYGSNNKSDKGEALVVSKSINNTTWATHTFTIKPDQDINHLTLEVSISESVAGNGNLLIDNLQLSDYFETRIILRDTFQTSDLPIGISASESPTYSWSPSTGLTCYNCQSPEVNSNTSRTYTCTIEDESTTCPMEELFIFVFDDTDTIEPLEPIDTITPVEPPVEPTDFKIPNVFTPNGDNINDVFKIQGLPPYSSLIIYDRSGRELYSSDHYVNTWDGRDQEGNPLPEENYWYVLITPGLEGRFKGYVYLKRK